MVNAVAFLSLTMNSLGPSPKFEPFVNVRSLPGNPTHAWGPTSCTLAHWGCQGLRKGLGSLSQGEAADHVGETEAQIGKGWPRWPLGVSAAQRPRSVCAGLGSK